MAFSIPGSSRLRESAEFRFLCENPVAVLLWPGVCLTLGILLWGKTYSDLRADKRTLEEQSLKVTTSLSKGYAQHLIRTIEQLDQVTLQAKYSWQESAGSFRLEALKREGLFTVTHSVAVTIFDRNGDRVTSTFPFDRKVSITDRDYFEVHKGSGSSSLYIGAPVRGKVSGKEIIPISRRLNGASGAFDGVVVISVEPEFFSLYSDDPVLGADGLLALTGKDGVVRMTKVGNVRATPSAPFVHRAGELGGYTEPALLAGTSWFADGKARLVASQPLDPYPFYAVVGLSQEEVLQPYEQMRAVSRRTALAASFVLLLFAIVSTFLSVRLAWRKHLTDALRNTYRVATEGGNEAYLMGRAIREDSGEVVDFEIVDCNERAAVLVQTGKQRLINSRLSAVYRGEHFEDAMRSFRAAMESGYYEDEYEVPDDSIVNAQWLHRRMVRSGDFLAITLRDVSEQKTHESELNRLATHDRLTGLPNRHWLMNNLPKVLERAHRANKQVAVLSIDLDNFKNVNDSAGHSVGDQLLQTVATRLRTVSRPADCVVRVGGDEFMVVREAITSVDDPTPSAQRILDALRVSIEIGERKHAIGASIGISMFPRDGSDAGTLLKNADIAMYSVKSESKGRFRFYDEKLYERIRKRLDIEHELSRALEEDHFVMHYQPRVNAGSGELVGMEALVRWIHPERGMIPPNDFIPLAESTGMILALGELLMNKTCAQLAEWIAQGLPVVPVSVNVSARQFNEGKVKDVVAACLSRYRIPAGLLEIELTESAMMGDFDTVIEEVHAINALGVKIHVDDFGTGYSSLSLLHRLEMDVLKVDRAFTSQLGNGQDGRIFFAAIVSMAKALGMSVIAEGVETAEQLRILQGLDCDEIQGYLVSRPLPADQVPAMIRKRMLLS
jgi:diguanylate cyclase (GGDEF)-like protein